ncbi:MAG TPA: hypothetical protein VF041_03870 [Gemmatimonadaceae bacterium]
MNHSLMSERITHTALFSLLLLAACQPPPDARRTPSTGFTTAATPRRAASSDSSAVAFVRQFYATYAPRAIAQGLSATDSVIVRQPTAFAPELLTALRQDAVDRAAAKGEIVGLDFEPFLASQDPCERYEVGEAHRAGSSVRVSVYAVCQGKRTPQPVAVAEVTPAAGTWQLANIRYPDGGDLLTILRSQ